MTVCLLFYNTSEVMQLAKCNVEWYYDACKEHRIVYDPTKDSQVSTLYIVHCTLYIVHVHIVFLAFFRCHTFLILSSTEHYIHQRCITRHNV